MQVSITKGGIGWTFVALFWLVIAALVMFLLGLPGDSGAGYVFMGFFMAVGFTFPLLLLPFGIIVYGIRKERDQPLWKVLLKWGTIATAVYLVCLPLVVLTFYA